MVLNKNYYTRKLDNSNHN